MNCKSANICIMLCCATFGGSLIQNCLAQDLRLNPATTDVETLPSPGTVIARSFSSSRTPYISPPRIVTASPQTKRRDTLMEVAERLTKLVGYEATTGNGTRAISSPIDGDASDDSSSESSDSDAANDEVRTEAMNALCKICKSSGRPDLNQLTVDCLMSIIEDPKEKEETRKEAIKHLMTVLGYEKADKQPSGSSGANGN